MEAIGSGHDRWRVWNPYGTASRSATTGALARVGDGWPGATSWAASAIHILGA